MRILIRSRSFSRFNSIVAGLLLLLFIFGFLFYTHSMLLSVVVAVIVVGFFSYNFLYVFVGLFVSLGVLFIVFRKSCVCVCGLTSVQHFQFYL